MSSYAVTGASRGLGLEFVRQLSSNPQNIVFALVRNPNNAQELLSLAKSTGNVHVIRGDLVDNESLKSAAQEIGTKTGGSLDYLINNAAFVQDDRRYNKLTDYIGDEANLKKDFLDSYESNVVGVIQTINAFLPLLQKGTVKKVVTLSTGLADVDFTIASEFSVHVPYSASKAAVNMVVAKYAIQFRSEGFLFLAISPGLVDTSLTPPTPEELAGAVVMGEKFKKAAPGWNGLPIKPQESVERILQVVSKSTSADTGAFVSHFGNKEWL